MTTNISCLKHLANHGRHRFVEYENAADLRTAVEKLDGCEFKGTRVQCIVDVGHPYSLRSMLDLKTYVLHRHRVKYRQGTVDDPGVPVDAHTVRRLSMDMIVAALLPEDIALHATARPMDIVTEARAETITTTEHGTDRHLAVPWMTIAAPLLLLVDVTAILMQATTLRLRPTRTVTMGDLIIVDHLAIFRLHAILGIPLVNPIGEENTTEKVDATGKYAFSLALHSASSRFHACTALFYLAFALAFSYIINLASFQRGLALTKGFRC